MRLASLCFIPAFSFALSNQEARFNLFDRFKATIPAEYHHVQSFDPSLEPTEDDVWVAVFRSSNNKPSVMIKDDFLRAMRSAVDVIEEPTMPSPLLETSASGGSKPVAVARLRPSQHFPNTWVLDNMRCILKKEKTDEACDGGSEHTEAISTAIDTLLLHHLSTSTRFERAIRTKATLVSGTLLESRGFVPIEKLHKDMATHVSSIDACLDRYAARSTTTDSKSLGATNRALSIVSFLGRIDRDMDLQVADEIEKENEEPEYDPWANVWKL